MNLSNEIGTEFNEIWDITGETRLRENFLVFKKAFENAAHYLHQGFLKNQILGKQFTLTVAELINIARWRAVKSCSISRQLGLGVSKNRIVNFSNP